MRILVESLKSLEIYAESRFKALWVINTLDGTEDYLVSDMLLIGNKMKVFQNDFIKKSPKNLKDLLKLIAPPKGLKRNVADTGAPIDEGQELFDCDGAELNYIDEASDDEGNNQAEQPTSPENNQPPITPVEPPAPAILADLCEQNPELKKMLPSLIPLVLCLPTPKHQSNFFLFLITLNAIMSQQ